MTEETVTVISTAVISYETPEGREEAIAHALNWTECMGHGTCGQYSCMPNWDGKLFGWVSVGDGLPEAGDFVAAIALGHKTAGWLRDDGRWWSIETGCEFHPTHWMPLPEAPE